MNKEDILSKIDLAVILTIFVGICYGLTYLYYAGQFIYYGIPIIFIDIDVKNVFFTMLILSPIIINIIGSFTASIQMNIIPREDSNSKKGSLKEINWRIVQRELNSTIKGLYEIDDDILDLEVKWKNIKLELETTDTTLLSQEELENLDHKKKEIKQLEKELNLAKQRQEISKEKIAKWQKDLNEVKNSTIKRIIVLVTVIGFLLIIIFYMFNREFYTIAFSIIGHLAFLTISSYFLKRGNYVWPIITLIVFMVSFTLGIGYNNSYHQERYITFEKDNDDYIVLSVYEDQFLYTSLDKDNMIAGNGFNLIDIKDVEKFERHRVGVIQLE